MIKKEISRKVIRMLNFKRLRLDDGDKRGAGAGPAKVGRIAICALLMTAAALAAGSAWAQPQQSACLNPTGAIALSRCGTGNITIGPNGCAASVYLDKTNTVGNITIAPGGTLTISDQAAQGGISLTTAGIEIQGDPTQKVGGTLKIGDPMCPIGTLKAADLVTVKFTGTHPADCGDITKGSGNYVQCQGYQKGIQVDASGAFFMYGLKGVPPAGAQNHTLDWTYLASAAGPAVAGAKVPPASATQITVAGDVTAGNTNRGWKPGDWIAVATTSFSPWETEFVQIKNLTFNPVPNQTVINLGNASATQKLVYYHFGGPPPTMSQLCPIDGVLTAVACGGPQGNRCASPCTGAPSPLNYNDTAATNFGVDERAEVGLISRNIVLTSDADTPPVGQQGKAGGNLHWGGETRILAGFTAFVMQGVQLQKFGKEMLGAYPIHFHIDGDVSKAQVLVDSNSIDHSYNKCITIHSTSNLSITNNVCARITGHIFYEEVGDEQNITLDGNLGMGAMSNSFSVNGGADMPASELIAKYYWPGDNLNNLVAGVGNSPGKLPFDQFYLFNPDNQQNPVVGWCFTPFPASDVVNSGILRPLGAPGSCIPPNVYLEPPSGIWIVNPSMILRNNSIAGCQDVGMGYWYVTPTNKPGLPAKVTGAKFIPIGPKYTGLHGEFTNNRVHGCYGGLYSDSNAEVVSAQLQGYLNGNNIFPGSPPNHAVTDQFDQLTATRIRWRSLWLRPSFVTVDQSRFGTNRRSLSFVTSGGTDGNYPGLYTTLTNSVIAGVSQNNVDRFGPCGALIRNSLGQVIRGGQRGCIDVTPLGKTDPVPATTGVFLADGYATPQWNLFGFQIYDGPPLIVHNRFVNFRQDPAGASLLTPADASLQKSWIYNNPYKRYEGDAALGWLEGNQSAYPTAATSNQLSWTNVDFRHQIYTQFVNNGNFLDGDKNTAVIDQDGTLSGLAIGDSKGNAVPHAYPISLNDLPFNNTTNSTTSGNMAVPANSAAECLSTGQQNVDVEGGRPTGVMSPAAIGQLEFEALYPPPIPGWGRTQQLTFYKNNLDFGAHGAMALKSRNGLAVWEPKVASGYGYVARADPYVFPPGTNPPQSKAGIPATVDVTIDDVVKPNISSTKPFYIQLGICYTAQNGLPPVPDPTASSMFTITRGYRTYGNGDGGDVEMANQWVQLNRQFLGEVQPNLQGNNCYNLDSQLEEAKMPNDCPARGIIPKPAAGCPAGTSQGNGTVAGRPVSWCFYPKSTLQAAASLAGMTTNGQPNGPPNLDNYFYDSTTGMLYVWIRQTEPNAPGASPIGNCTGNPATDPPFCPVHITGDTYYVCPKEGCSSIRVQLNAMNYVPGVSNCPVFGPGGTANDWVKNTGGATWPNPPTIDQNFLVFAGTTTIAQTKAVGTTFPYNDVTSSMLSCPMTSE
jgi:hypothetical protein